MSNYITRSKVLERACHDMIREMYLRAQPAVDIDTYEECYRRGILDPERDRCYEWHYLPMEIQSQIVNDYLGAYCADDQFKKWCEFLMNNFKNGGHREVHRDVFGTGEMVRTSEKTEKLNELIGDDNADKVYSLINDFIGFYRTNMDEHTVRCAIFQCPTSNPSTVIARWGDDFKIDDSVYKGWDEESWDYTYKDYYDGVCQGDAYRDDLWDREDENN